MVPDKEFKALVIRMLTELMKRIDEHHDSLNKELQNIKEKQTELKNTITETKNIPEEIKSWLGKYKVNKLHGYIVQQGNTVNILS